MFSVLPAYITPETASELVKLEPVWDADPLPSATGRSDCPHEAGGLSSWHDASTWDSGSVPVADGSDVDIPAGAKVLLSSSASADGAGFGRIHVPLGAELIFGESDAVIALNTSGIFVEGVLRMGAPTCRLEARIELTLWGARPDGAGGTISQDAWVKGIYASGRGELHFFGHEYTRTWSRLAAPVAPGDTVVYLQHAVNWEAGQTLLLTTTELKDDRTWHRNELLTIGALLAAPEGAGAAVQLTSGAAFRHEASSAYQAEAALLSRRIVIAGSIVDSPPTDVDPFVCEDSESTLGQRAIPCADSYLTGYGGHVMAEGESATLRMAGVELARMGQTNVLGRYPVHMHLMGATGGARSYVRDCAIHESYYRCAALHGTSNATVAHTVAYDAIGHCFYLEDGVEEHNTLAFNLAAHVHFVGSPARVGGQYMDDVAQTDDLTLPADVTASGFYITNGWNWVLGNAASGGWAGFAFPILPAPLKLHRSVPMTPEARPLLAFRGNSAHSSGFWWGRGGAAYFGGELTEVADAASDDGHALVYNPGRINPARDTCSDPYGTEEQHHSCRTANDGFTVIEDTKVFLSRGVGMSHWGSRMEVVRFEAHDVGLGLAILAEKGYLHDALLQCRSGWPLHCVEEGCTDNDVGDQFPGNGFEWYDTGQAHILTNITFRGCGVSAGGGAEGAPATGGGAGCGDGGAGCNDLSSVWLLLCHSDEHVPEFMQASAGIRYEDCGRTFRCKDHITDSGRDLDNGMRSSLSRRAGSWLDVDGSATGLGAASIIGSAEPEAGDWWRLDEHCLHSAEGPLWFCARRGLRQIGSLYLEWDAQAQAANGDTVCGNGEIGLPCVPYGYIQHWGRDGSGLGTALPITLNGEVVGALGGFGWHLMLTLGAPRRLTLTRVQVKYDTAPLGV